MINRNKEKNCPFSGIKCEHSLPDDEQTIWQRAPKNMMYGALWGTLIGYTFFKGRHIRRAMTWGGIGIGFGVSLRSLQSRERALSRIQSDLQNHK
jgi:hypothetical protein